jgi:hypothetical protein
VEGEQLIIDLKGIAEFLPVILLLVVFVWARGKRAYQWLIGQPLVMRYVNVPGSEPAQAAQEDCATLAQRQIEAYWQGTIEPIDIKAILEAHYQLTESDQQYSRLEVCKRAFNSTSSAPYRKTKMVLDALDHTLNAE